MKYLLAAALALGISTSAVAAPKENRGIERLILTPDYARMRNEEICRPYLLRTERDDFYSRLNTWMNERFPLRFGAYQLFVVYRF